MPRLPRPFIIEKRKNCNYKLTLSLSSGLPQRVCTEWYRKSFKNFPDALAIYRYPRNKSEAERGTLALIQYLQHNHDDVPIAKKDILVEIWLKKFITLDDNPRAARLIGLNLTHNFR
ncbi:MAG: hypothetical protein LBK43_03905 [Treponema sp.]|nr:hypothetical protein [Treponema sp.]